MKYVAKDGASMPAVDAVIIPINANRNTEALYSISDQWTGLVAPDREETALRRNAEHLTETLSRLGSNSIFLNLYAQPEGLTKVGSIDARSPTGTYEGMVLFGALNDGILKKLDDGFMISNDFCCIAAIADSLDPYSTEIHLRVEDSNKYLEFLGQLEERHQALQAGRLFANELGVFIATFKIGVGPAGPVELGSYTFKGVDQAAAAKAFLARNIPQLTSQSRMACEVHETAKEVCEFIDSLILSADGGSAQRFSIDRLKPLNSFQELKAIEDGLHSVVAFLPSRRVSQLSTGNGYEINADFLSFCLKINAEGNIEISARLHPRLTRDPKLWFSSSTSAKELTSVFLATGVAQAVPHLVEHASEIATDLRWGNGYASLSRMICGLLSGSRESDRNKLVELDGLFEGKLADHLLLFREMSSSTATHLVIDLLVGALGNGNPDPSLPVFRGPQEGEHIDVNSCDDAEGYFVSAVHSKKYTVDRYFLHKSRTSGEPTSLTRVPIVINGTLIPRGTLCVVRREQDIIKWVQPIRLTLFNLPLDGEGADVFQHHLHKLYGFGSNEDDVLAVYRELDESQEKSSGSLQ
jgi:hypothetical protein